MHALIRVKRCSALMCVHLETTFVWISYQRATLCSAQIAAMRSDFTMVSIARVFELFAELNVSLGEQLASNLQVLATHSCCSALLLNRSTIPSYWLRCLETLQHLPEINTVRTMRVFELFMEGFLAAGRAPGEQF